MNDLPVQGPDLPLGKIWGNSMVKVNPKMIYIIGGYTELNPSNKTWIMDTTDNFRLKEGPSMIDITGLNESTKMILNGNICIVTMQQSAVEILDTTSSCWKKGKRL